MSRKMELGDLYQPGQLVPTMYAIQHIVGVFGDMLVKPFAEITKHMTFATGGYINPKLVPTELPEGVVAYTPSGRPVYDGDWFDARMKPAHSVTITVNQK